MKVPTIEEIKLKASVDLPRTIKVSYAVNTFLFNGDIDTIYSYSDYNSALEHFKSLLGDTPVSLTVDVEYYNTDEDWDLMEEVEIANNYEVTKIIQKEL